MSTTKVVIQVLTERLDGKGCWSYKFEDGIWGIKESIREEIVEFETDFKPLKDIK